jgi:hypothetical protein
MALLHAIRRGVSRPFGLPLGEQPAQLEAALPKCQKTPAISAEMRPH